MADNLFFISARTQHENLGDALITRELLRLLGGRGRVELYEGGMPASFLATIQAHQHSRHSTARTFAWSLLASALRRMFRKTAPRVYLVLNPGGFSGGYSATQVPRHVALVMGYALLSVAGVRIVRLGQSIGPFKGVRERIERWKAHWMHAVTARDPLSLEYAGRVGIRQPRYFPDLAFLMSADVTQRSSEPRPTFAVASFRAEPHLAGYDSKVLAQLSEVFSAGGVLSSLPLRFATQVTFDLARNQELERLLAHLPGGVSQLAATDLESLQRVYGESAVVVSNRLHVLLLALRAGTPVFALVDPAVNAKIVGLFEAIGLQEHVINISAPRWPAVIPDRIAFQRRAAEIFNAQSAIAHDAIGAILR